MIFVLLKEWIQEVVTREIWPCTDAKNLAKFLLNTREVHLFTLAVPASGIGGYECFVELCGCNSWCNIEAELVGFPGWEQLLEGLDYRAKKFHTQTAASSPVEMSWRSSGDHCTARTALE